MTATVILSPTAAEQLSRIDDWWRVNRPAAPTLFADELSSALEVLAVMPRIGHRYRKARARGMRRLHLRRSRCHVYYQFDRATQSVWVASIWSAVREGPPL